MKADGETLLAALKQHFSVETDRALAEKLETDPSQISRVRYFTQGKRRPGPQFRVDVARATDWPMSKIDRLLGSKL